MRWRGCASRASASERWKRFARKRKRSERWLINRFDKLGQMRRNIWLKYGGAWSVRRPFAAQERGGITSCGPGRLISLAGRYKPPRMNGRAFFFCQHYEGRSIMSCKLRVLAHRASATIKCTVPMVVQTLNQQVSFSLFNPMVVSLSFLHFTRASVVLGVGPYREC